MQRFAFACLGVLALALAFHLGAAVGQSNPAIRAMSAYPLGGEPWVMMLTEEGDIWARTRTIGWQFNAPFPRLPFPPADLRVIDGPFLWDVHDNAWVYRGDTPGGTWENLGAPPGAVALEPTTWGRVKARGGR